MSFEGIEKFNKNLLKFMETDKFKNMSDSEKLDFGYRAVMSNSTLEVKQKIKKDKNVKSWRLH